MSIKLYLICLLLPLAVRAELQCPVDELVAYTWGSEVTDNYVHIDADAAQMSPKDVIFNGDVIAKRGQEVFYTDHIHYDRLTEVIDTDTAITYGRPDFALRAAGSNYSLKNQQGSFKQAEYYIKKQKANGQADQITINRQTQIEALTEATYTTCARKKPHWTLKAKQLHLDHKNDIGIAKHTTFRIMDTPIMYLPYFSFPISNKRKTGLLYPRLGNSKERGLEITTPFYINIAPNQDMTLSPRYMSRRGLMLGAEYRYLLPELTGLISGTYMPNDKQFHHKRWSFKTEHTYQPTDQLTIKGLYQRVSDKHYIEQLTDTLDLSEESFLPSYLSAIYQVNPNYTLGAEIKDYQVVKSTYTDANKPYSLLPRMTGKGQWTLGDHWSLSANTELTHFDKDDSVSGYRFNQELTLSYLYQNAYSFIKPAVTYRFNSYQLHDQEQGKPNSITHAIPTLSIDSGLFFDRQTTWLGRSATQTLEPRLFYLYTPYDKQSDSPNFDSSLVGASYSALFRDNRFNGGDRIGDTHQVTTAISTSYIDNENGRELARLSVGQVQYFKDRRVSLTNSIANASRSNIIAEGHADLNEHVNVKGLVHYDLDDNRTEKSLMQITYAPDDDKAISLSHLYQPNDYKQIDFAGVWRVNDYWRTFWRWNYSVRHHKPIDTILGVEYADCCWGVRLMARQQRKNLISNEKPNNSIYLEFVLNGLGNVGNDTTHILKDIIPTYHPIRYERVN